MKRLADLTPQTNIESGINMSPLIDMVFLLLIFFMVTAVFVKTEAITIKKPSAATSEPHDEDDFKVTITADGNYFVKDKRLELAKLEELLKQHDSIVINADRQSQTNSIVELMDLCRQTGIDSIALAVEKRYE